MFIGDFLSLFPPIVKHRQDNFERRITLIIVEGFYILIREATGMSEGKYFGNFLPLFLNILKETGYAGSLVLEYFDSSSLLEAKVKLLRLLKRF